MSFFSVLFCGVALCLFLGVILSVPVNVPAGKDGYAYANTGSHGSPTWAVQSNIQDVKLGDAITLYALNLRNSGGFTTNVPTVTDWNPTFKVAEISGDPFLTALLAAKNNKTAIDMQFLSGPSVPATGVTVQGPRADWIVEKMERDETNTQAIMYDVSLKPGQTGNTPSWVSITGS